MADFNQMPQNIYSEWWTAAQFSSETNPENFQMKKGGWSQHAFYILGVSWEITFCDNGIYEQLVIDQWL